MPVALVVLGLLPRIWAPDLVPWGALQSAFVRAASASDGVGSPAGSDRVAGAVLALVEVPLRAVGAGVTAWVVVRGLVDAAAVALVYLAARPLAGSTGAALAAALYAASPAAVGAARDPAGTVAGALGAGALLAGLAVLRRPTTVPATAMGGLLGLLAQAGLPAIAVVGLGALVLAAGRAGWRTVAGAVLALALTGWPALVGDGGPNGPAWPSAGSASTLLGALLIGPRGGLADGAMAGIFAPPTSAAWAVAALLAGVVALGWWAAIRAWRDGQRAPLVVGLWLAVLAVCAVSAAPGTAGPSEQSGPSGGGDAAVCAVASALALFAAVATAVGRPVPRWASLALAGLVLVVQVGSLAIAAERTARVAATPGVFASSAADGGVGRAVGQNATLRDWQALASTVREVAGRVGTREVVVLGDGTLADRLGPLLDRRAGEAAGPLAVRTLSSALVLPLERETVHVLVAPADAPANAPADAPIDGPADAAAGCRPVELGRPASSVAVVTPAGTDTGARVVTLRPRPATDWLAPVRTVADGRFADSSRLLGLTVEATAAGSELVLYWELPPAADGRAVGATVLVEAERLGRSGAAEQALPPVPDRRSGELTVVRVTVGPVEGAAAGDLALRLLDERGRPIRTAGGAETLPLPVPGAGR